MEIGNSSVRIIAYYLPQYHPIPENDMWWGKGFTEWTNVGKAKSLFKGHYQPRIPADLGYYDLRLSEVREAQANMAKEYGIYGFCYWHYWFGNGKRLLERPAREMLKAGKPDFPYCFAWANATWKGFAHGVRNRNVLIEQTYPGEQDYIAHFNEVLPYFMDQRYIRIDGKPVFVIYNNDDFDNEKRFMELWQSLAVQHGLKGVYFIAESSDISEEKRLLDLGFDAINLIRLFDYQKKNSLAKRLKQYFNKRIRRMPHVYNYKDVYPSFTDFNIDSKEYIYPTIIPNWDHSPRSGREGMVLHNSTPEIFRKHLKEVLSTQKFKPDRNRIVFLKSWNEWAEGNYMEPDLRFGLKYLEVLKEELNNISI